MTLKEKIEMYSRLLRKAEHSYYLQNKRRRRGSRLPPDVMEEALVPRPGEVLTRSQQVALLQSGVENWNEWYETSEEWADLREADLREADLREANLEGANLSGAYYDKYTKFPRDFLPEEEGMIKSKARRIYYDY